MNYPKEFWEIIKATYDEWKSDHAPMLAASLAYYTAFSLAPLVIIVIGITGIFFDPGDVQGRIIAEIHATIGEGAAELVEETIENSNKETQSIISTILGIGALLFGALGLFSNLQTALDRIWDVAEVEREGGIKAFIRNKLLSFGAVLVIGFLLLVSLLLSTAIAFLDEYVIQSLPLGDVFLQLISWMFSYLIITVLFMFIYKWLPHAVIRWRDVVIGAAVTALLFTLGQFGLGIYLGRAAPSSTYGAAGAMVLILLWVYYSAQILLFGAEFTQVYARRYGEKIVADVTEEVAEEIAEETGTDKELVKRKVEDEIIEAKESVEEKAKDVEEAQESAEQAIRTIKAEVKTEVQADQEKAEEDSKWFWQRWWGRVWGFIRRD